MYSQFCQTLGFCEFFQGIGIEKGVHGLGRPIYGRGTILGGPSVDLAYLFDQKRMFQFMT